MLYVCAVRFVMKNFKKFLYYKALFRGKKRNKNGWGRSAAEFDPKITNKFPLWRDAESHAHSPYKIPLLMILTANHSCSLLCFSSSFHRESTEREVFRKKKRSTQREGNNRDEPRTAGAPWSRPLPRRGRRLRQGRRASRRRPMLSCAKTSSSRSELWTPIALGSGISLSFFFLLWCSLFLVIWLDQPKPVGFPFRVECYYRLMTLQMCKTLGSVWLQRQEVSIFWKRKTFTCQMGMSFQFSLSCCRGRDFYGSQSKSLQNVCDAGSHGLKWPHIPFSESTA